MSSLDNLRKAAKRWLKAIRAGIDSGDVETAKDALSGAFSLVDKMANKGIIHRNAAGRYKSRLVKRVSTKSSAA